VTDFDDAALVAERAVLCAVMEGGPKTLAEVRDLLSGSMFRAPHHESIWNAVTTLADAGSPIKPASVTVALTNARELGRGLLTTEYWVRVTTLGTNPTDAFHYAKTVRAEAKRRKGLALGGKVRQAFNETDADDLDDVMARLLSEMQALTADEFDAPTRKRKLLLTPASDIEMRPTSWLWDTTPDGAPPTSQGRFPVDSLILAAGKPGLGKSQFGVWIAAELTNGTLPGCHFGHPRSVIYAATEDSWEMTLAPRLVAAGADLKRVYRIDVEDIEDARITLPRDIAGLGALAQQYDVALLVLDPLLSALDASVNDYRAKEVRAALEPLVVEAQRSSFTILGLAHFNKASGADPLDAVSGSNAFGALVRAAVAFAPIVEEDGDDEGGQPAGDKADRKQEFVMSLIKNNYGRLNLPSHKYEIQPVTVETPGGNAYVSRFHVTGLSDTSVREVMRTAMYGGGQGGAKVSKEDQAWVWILTLMADGPVTRSGIEKQGTAAGHATRTLERALSDARKRGDAITQSYGFGVDKIAWWGRPEHRDAIAAKKTHPRHTHARGGDEKTGGNGGDGAHLTVVPDYTPSPEDEGETGLGFTETDLPDGWTES